MPPQRRFWVGSMICRRKQTEAPTLNALSGDLTRMAQWTLLCGERLARQENHLRASDENFPTEEDSPHKGTKLGPGSYLWAWSLADAH